MAIEIRYELSQISNHNDGSGMVAHAIGAQSNTDDAGWVTIANRSKTINVPYAQVDVVMAMPDGTAQQKQAKNQAYKDMLVANVNTQNEPVFGWDKATLTAIVTTNASVDVSIAAVLDYLNNTLGVSLPVGFNL